MRLTGSEHGPRRQESARGALGAKAQSESRHTVNRQDIQVESNWTETQRGRLGKGITGSQSICQWEAWGLDSFIQTRFTALAPTIWKMLCWALGVQTYIPGNGGNEWLIATRTFPQEPVLLFLQLQAQEVIMDLPPQYVLTTDIHWASRAVMLLMSFHSKAFQQSSSTELILSPYPSCKGAPASNHHKTCISTPLSPLSWYLVASSRHATCLSSLCHQGQELIHRAWNDSMEKSEEHARTSQPKRQIDGAQATELAHKPRRKFILIALFDIIMGLYINHENILDKMVLHRETMYSLITTSQTLPILPPFYASVCSFVQWG